jgi:hypothetical protein
LDEYPNADLILTTVQVLAAVVVTTLTLRMLRVQTHPQVVVYVEHDDTRRTVLQIVIKNVGHGIARDVKFDLSRSLPRRAWGLKMETASVAGITEDGPLVQGIPALGPGSERRIDWVSSRA